MLTIPAALRTHMMSGQTTLAWGVKITRTDATVYGFVGGADACTISGQAYVPYLGLTVSDLVSSAGFQADNLEVTVLPDADYITKADVLAGRWDGAAFELFLYNWAAPADGRAVLLTGHFGTVKPKRGAYVAELRSLRTRLATHIGTVTQPTCRNRLGDARCGVNLAPYTHSGTISAVTSNRVFRDATIGQAADYFKGGELTWDTGDNAGLTVKVAAFAADGTFTLALPMVLPVQVGDTYTAVRGCLKRLDEDCATVFGNELNFWGEPHVPGADAVTGAADPAEAGA